MATADVYTELEPNDEYERVTICLDPEKAGKWTTVMFGILGPCDDVLPGEALHVDDVHVGTDEFCSFD